MIEILLVFVMSKPMTPCPPPPPPPLEKPVGLPAKEILLIEDEEDKNKDKKKRHKNEKSKIKDTPKIVGNYNRRGIRNH